MKRIKQFDFFRRPKQDLVKTSFGGAFISVATILIILLLSYNEFSLGLSTPLTKQFIVGSGEGEDGNRYKIDFEMVFLNCPCGLLSVVQEDLTNATISNETSIEKVRLDKNGSLIANQTFIDQELKSEFPDIRQNTQLVATGIDNEEKCKLTGLLEVNKIPGRIKINFALKKDILKEIRKASELLFEAINLSHRINKLIFLPLKDNKAFSMRNRTINSAIDTEVISTSPFSADYYVKVMPESYNSSENYTYAYSFHQSTYHLPEKSYTKAEITIGYETVPFIIKYKKGETFSWFNFFMTVSGICCGMLFIGRIAHSLLIKCLRELSWED